jgi:D-alanyl-lipoteichoic acid acyltransferase DltB (MBOAT superfamily)
MNICSLEFFFACCLAPILFHLLPGKLPRQLFLSALNLAFLWTFVPNNRSWVCFALFIVGTYAILWLIRKRPSGLVVFLAIAVVLAAFLVVKKYTFLEWIVPEKLWDHYIAMIGISYMLFKFIHVLVDTWQGQLEPFTLFSYANYQLGFFSLVAGPIQRYNDFHKYWELMDPGPGDTLQILLAWNRLLNGFIKMGGLAAIALFLYDRANLNWGPQSSSRLVLRFLVLFYSYAFYLYLNFSGYMDIVIGSARLFGFELPENFNQPYLARNVVDFWNRWHITLSHWIRDYVFMTSYKATAEWFPNWSKYLGYFLVFFSLFLAGVWHGSTMNFAIFGLIHGIGAMVVQIYGDLLKWRLGRTGYLRYMKNEWIRWIAIIVTFHYICFSLLFFAMDMKAASNVLEIVWNAVL